MTWLDKEQIVSHNRSTLFPGKQILRYGIHAFEFLSKSVQWDSFPAYMVGYRNGQYYQANLIRPNPASSAAWNPVAATSWALAPLARSFSTFNLASARLSLFSLRFCSIAFISSLLNWYLLASQVENLQWTVEETVFLCKVQALTWRAISWKEGMDWDRHCLERMPIYIQPGGVNGRVMNFQALCDLSGDGRVKGFIERSNGVNIQIIHDQHNLYHSGCNGPPPTRAGNVQNPRLSWCRSALLLSFWPAVQTRRTSLPHRSGGIHNPLALDFQVSAESSASQ